MQCEIYTQQLEFIIRSLCLLVLNEKSNLFNLNF